MTSVPEVISFMHIGPEFRVVVDIEYESNSFFSKLYKLRRILLAHGQICH